MRNRNNLQLSMNIQSLLSQANIQLTSISSTPQLDAEWLLAHVLKISRSQLRTRIEQIISATDYQHYCELLNRRQQGEPVAYIIGEWEFWSLSLKVTRDTLIPRPETELLVELVLQKLAPQPVQQVADLGTGTGAIALALASERPHWQITATDKSPSALAVAKNNASALAIKNVSFYEGNWCQALPTKNYDVIVSNPPYIEADNDCLGQDGIRFEPHSALVSGQDGCQALRIIIEQAREYLCAGGWLLLEHGYNQGAVMRELFNQNHFTGIATYQDLASLDRVSVGKL